MRSNLDPEQPQRPSAPEIAPPPPQTAPVPGHPSPAAPELPIQRGVLKAGASANPSPSRLGPSQSFVLAQGFSSPAQDALRDHTGQVRLFAELTADPDRPDVRPQEAYAALLSSLQPGWQLRMLQVCWPDPAPRQAFYAQAQAWQPAIKGLELLQQGLLHFTTAAPLPFLCRTILEFVVLNAEGQAWWEGISPLLASFGLHLRQLHAAEIAALANRVFNPELE